MVPIVLDMFIQVVRIAGVTVLEALGVSLAAAWPALFVLSMVVGQGPILLCSEMSLVGMILVVVLAITREKRVRFLISRGLGIVAMSSIYLGGIAVGIMVRDGETGEYVAVLVFALVMFLGSLLGLSHKRLTI